MELAVGGDAGGVEGVELCEEGGGEGEETGGRGGEE